MPTVATLYREPLSASGVTVIGISQFKTNEANSIAFIKQGNLSFLNVYDEDAQIAQAYTVRGVPTYVFIDRDGHIAATSSSARGVGLIEDRPLDHLLSYSAPSGAHIQRSKLAPTGSIDRDQTTSHYRRNICAHARVLQ